MRLRGGTRVFPDGTRLTPRQEEVIGLVEDGLTNGEIAHRLNITLDGAKFHMTEIMNRYGVHSREEAVAAWKQGQRRMLGVPIGMTWALAGGGVVAAAVVIAAIVVAMASWPDDGDSSSPLSQAAETASDSSARFTMELTTKRPGEPAQAAQVATGELDFRRNRMHISPPEGGMEQIFADGKSYQRLGPDALWRESDASDAKATGAFTPAYWFDRMKSAKDVVEVGTEVVRGETATIYQFTAPYPTVPGAGTTYAKTELHFVVWLAGGRVIRMEERSEFVETGDPEMDGQTVFVRIELEGWNDPVSIEVPKPEEIER